MTTAARPSHPLVCLFLISIVACLGSHIPFLIYETAVNRSVSFQNAVVETLQLASVLMVRKACFCTNPGVFSSPAAASNTSFEPT
jgi:hypothetical protein